MKPSNTWKHRGIDIAEWRSDKGVSYSIRKTYKDKQTGEYKESKYWYREELVELYRLLGEATATFETAPKAPDFPAVPPKIDINTDDIPF